jgi:hypothetical protein
MRELPQQVIAKVSGTAWEPLRKQFLETGRILLEVSPDARGELVGHYVKFTMSMAPNSPPYAVLWLKNSKRLVVGLALPETYEAEGLGPSVVSGTFYKGLTKYFTVEPGGAVPQGLADWSRRAYQNLLSANGKHASSMPTKHHGGRTGRERPIAALSARGKRKAA